MFDTIRRRRLIVGALGTLVGGLAVGLTLSACAPSGGTPIGGNTESSSGDPPITPAPNPSPTEPQEKVDITSPTGVIITATIASASLGDGCGFGGGYCQSNVQLAFKASAGTKNAAIEVVKVVLLDATSDAVVDTLAVSSPAVWNGRGYVAWNQQVPPNGDLKASYTLASPEWQKIEGTGKTGTTYGKNYKFHVTLRIDGVEVILVSSSLTRTPPAVT